MMNDSRKLPDSMEKMERRRRKAAWQDAQRESNSAEDGRRAWDAVKKWRQESKVTLNQNDREAIAQNLWKELEKYKEGTLTDLFRHAELPSNIKDKVTLQPGKTSKKLKAEVAPYLKLIEALADKTHKDRDVEEARNLLADRVLLRTSFHPVSFAKLQEAKLILDALNVAVDRIDLEFKLWEQCKAIAEVRKPREAAYVDAVRRGDEETAWVELQFNENNSPHVIDNPVEKWWPLEEFLLSSFRESPPGSATPLINIPIEPANAFWLKPYQYHDSWAAGVWSGESIFFFPHVYLGPAIGWYGNKPELPEKDDLWVDMSAVPEPIVRFEGALQEYRVYLRDPKTSEESHGGFEFDWGMNWEMSLAARWLIIYPDPDAKRLVPAILSRGEFMSTELLPLSARLIAEFGDPNHWQYVGRDDAPTLLQRLKDLTGYVTGDFEIMDAWRETAARFHLNPIFRSSRPSEIEKILYRRHLENWIAENRRSSDSHEDEE